MTFLIIIVLSILVTLIFTPFVGFWFFVLSLVGWFAFALIKQVSDALFELGIVKILWGLFLSLVGLLMTYQNLFGSNPALQKSWWITIFALLTGVGFILAGFGYQFGLGDDETTTKSKKSKMKK